MHYCILSLGCFIHPRVFERLGVVAFPAPPTTNFSGMTGQPVKIQGACFLRVTHPEHPEEKKQDRQLFYVKEESVTLSKSCCKTIASYYPISRGLPKQTRRRMEEMIRRACVLCPGLMAEEEPRLRRVGGELFIKREWSMVIFQYFPLLLCFFIF